MRQVQVKSLIPYLLGSTYIGHGKCAFCFLMRDGRVLKVFYNSYNKRELFFYHNDMSDFFDYISKFNNRTFYGPQELLIKDDVCGYIMDKAPGKTLKTYHKDISLDDYLDLYDILLKDVKEATKKDNLRLGDLHQKNIILGSIFQLIDLDNCTRKRDMSVDRLINYNMQDVIEILTNFLLGVRDCYDIIFEDNSLADLYKLSRYREYEAYIEFINKLSTYGNTAKEIRSKEIVRTRRQQPYYSQML